MVDKNHVILIIFIYTKPQGTNSFNNKKIVSQRCNIKLYFSLVYKSCFCFFTDGKQDEEHELDMITLSNYTTSAIIHDMTFSVLDMIILYSAAR